MNRRGFLKLIAGVTLSVCVPLPSLHTRSFNSIFLERWQDLGGIIASTMFAPNPFYDALVKNGQIKFKESQG